MASKYCEMRSYIIMTYSQNLRMFASVWFAGHILYV